MTIRMKPAAEAVPRGRPTVKTRGCVQAYEACAARSVAANSDRVEISSQGLFSARLAELCKKTDEMLNQPVAPEKIRQLKQQYANGSCPVSGDQIAQAMLCRIERTVV